MKILLTDVAMCVMVRELKKRHNHQQKKTRTASHKKDAFYIASVDIFQRVMHPVCTFVGALVSLGNKTRIAWYVRATRRHVSNRRTVRSYPLRAGNS